MPNGHGKHNQLRRKLEDEIKAYKEKIAKNEKLLALLNDSKVCEFIDLN